METLIGYTIIADLGLLAIIIAIFIFAVTIYKGASELSVKEKENISKTRKNLIENRKLQLKKRMDTLKDSAYVDELRTELDKLDNEIRSIDKSIANIVNRANRLSAKYLVYIPSGLLLFSILLSGTAIGLSGVVRTIIWPISIVSLATAIYFMCKGIGNIEFFSNSIDLSTLMQNALEKHAEKNRPKLQLILLTDPIVEHDKSIKVEYIVSHEGGLMAKNIKVRFLATMELTFPGEKLKRFEFKKKKMNKPMNFEHELEDISCRAGTEGYFTVKAPQIPGEYFMSHWVTCDEFIAEEEYFTITVI